MTQQGKSALVSLFEQITWHSLHSPAPQAGQAGQEDRHEAVLTFSFVVPASSGQQHRVGQRRLCTFWFTWLVQVPWNGSRAGYVSCKIDHVSNLTINQHQGPGQGRQPGKSNQ